MGCYGCRNHEDRDNTSQSKLQYKLDALCKKDFGYRHNLWPCRGRRNSSYCHLQFYIYLYLGQSCSSSRQWSGCNAIQYHRHGRLDRRNGYRRLQGSCNLLPCHTRQSVSTRVLCHSYLHRRTVIELALPEPEGAFSTIAFYSRMCGRPQRPPAMGRRQAPPYFGVVLQVSEHLTLTWQSTSDTR